MIKSVPTKVLTELPLEIKSLDEALKEIPDTKPIPIPVPVPIMKPQVYTPMNTSSKTPSSKIAITSFIRSNCVYIRDGDEETTKRFNMVHRVVDQLAQNLTPIKSLPEEGTFLIMKNLDAFQRCTVLAVKGERQIKVFLSDSGKQEIVTISQLFEPGPRLEKLAETSFIKMIKLESVPEFYLNKKAAEYVKSLLGDDVFLGRLDISSFMKMNKIGTFRASIWVST